MVSAVLLASLSALFETALLVRESASHLDLAPEGVRAGWAERKTS